MQNFEDLAITMQLDEFEQALLQYIIDNIDNPKAVQIRSVAEANFTSTATVFKLAKRLGFNGYSELIFNLRTKPLTNPESAGFEMLFEDVAKHREQFQTLLNQYHDKRILVLGLGFSRLIANYISERLLLNGYQSITSDHIQLLLANYQKETLLIVVSQSGKNARLLENIQNAANRNIDIISFCGDANSPIAKHATLPITCEPSQISGNRLDVPNSFFAYAILCFEALLDTTT